MKRFTITIDAEDTATEKSIETFFENALAKRRVG
jgi:hypothetical protein